MFIGTCKSLKTLGTCKPPKSHMKNVIHHQGLIPSLRWRTKINKPNLSWDKYVNHWISQKCLKEYKMNVKDNFLNSIIKSKTNYNRVVLPNHQHHTNVFKPKIFFEMSSLPLIKEIPQKRPKYQPPILLNLKLDLMIFRYISTSSKINHIPK